jgi:tripartite-type tricarboxylate transporter receptor subunit TctC
MTSPTENPGSRQMGVTKAASRRHAIQGLAACAAVASTVLGIALPTSSLAATESAKPVTLVVPYPPGGATDRLARILNKPLGERLGQTVLVENKAGAGTAIGATAVAKSAPDGLTLLISSNTTFTVNPALKRTLPYDPLTSFEGIGVIGSSPLVLLAHPSVAANSVKDLVALARQQPGKLSFGSFGNGTTAHLAGEMFKSAAGVDIVHVPYKGSAPAMTDLIGGQIPLTFDTNVAAMPQMAAGKVKALAVTSSKRSSTMPQVPTIAESGYPGYEMVPWIVIVAPKGLPTATRDKLSQALQATVADPTVQADLRKAGIEVAWEPGSAYAERVGRELPVLKASVQKAGIPVE